MRRWGHTAAVIAAALLCAACSVTRKLPDGTYLVQKVKVEEDRTAPKSERIPASELKKYIRQTPNKRFLGLNFYVWMYEQADPAKTNWWNDFKRRIGQEPVLLDMALTEQSADNLKIYMDTKGFFASQASYEVDTLSRRKRAKITYRTRQGEPYRINRISYDFRDRFLSQLILPDTARTLLRPGGVFDITVLDRERERIASSLQRKGYYNFSVNNIEYVADTLIGGRRVDLKVVVKQYLTGYNERGEAVMEDNKVYRIGQINVMPDYDPSLVIADYGREWQFDTVHFRGMNVVYERKPNVRPRILRPLVALSPNALYDADQVTHTYNNLMSIGYFKSARIAFTEQPRTIDVTNYVTYLGDGGRPDSVQRLQTQEGYLQCDILCTPALKQSYKIELEGTTTSSFYGLKATVGYQNRNIFRGAEAFDVALSVGYEWMKAREARKRHAREIGISTGLSFPRFLLPFRLPYLRSVVQPKSRIELSVTYQDRPYYGRVLSSAAWSYSWLNRSYSTFTVKPINVNLIKMTRPLDNEFIETTARFNRYLIESYKTQLVAGLSFNYVYNNQRKHLNGNATLVQFNVETSGNLIDAFEHLFFKPTAGERYYTIFGIRYAQYVRADLNVSRKIMLGAQTAIVGRLYGGVGVPYGNSKDGELPYDRLFYAGGSNSMRGWTPRTLGPGSVPEPASVTYPSQVGDMKLEANLELRFPIWGMVHGATFLDAGNVWFLQHSTQYPDDAVFYLRNFYKQLGFDTGLGLRLDIKFAVLRLDWGLQLHNPNRPAGERWIRDFRWRNMALNFGVGYPF